MSVNTVYAPLPRRALIAVSGPDWRSFLQGLLTQDVETMAPGEARFAALLTPQGRVLWDMFIVARQDGAWLDVVGDQREAILQRLAMYRLRAKVEIAPLDLAISALFLPSPLPGGAGGASAAHTELTPPLPTLSSQGGEGFVADPRLPELGWRGYGAAQPLGATIPDDAAYRRHRLSLGVPGPADWGQDKTYPVEANFDLLNGIDFKKGCFVGQETTSRMKRRGQIKSRMLPIVFDGTPPAPGSELLAGTLRAGEVLSGFEGRAMALLRLDRAAGGSLTVDGRPVRAETPAWFLAAVEPA